MPARPRTEAVFRIFAERAASELRRLWRDRDLRDREAKLSALIGSAMDAIVELDKNLTVVGMNIAAEKVFRCAGALTLGQPLSTLVTSDCHDTLEELAAELLQQPPGERSLWIPEGLEARCLDGASFPAEATLSSFDLHGRPCFTLILRNVDERLEAEARIRELTTQAAYLSDEIDALQGLTRSSVRARPCVRR